MQLISGIVFLSSETTLDSAESRFAVRLAIGSVSWIFVSENHIAPSDFDQRLGF